MPRHLYLLPDHVDEQPEYASPSVYPSPLVVARRQRQEAFQASIAARPADLPEPPPYVYRGSILSQLVTRGELGAECPPACPDFPGDAA